MIEIDPRDRLSRANPRGFPFFVLTIVAIAILGGGAFFYWQYFAQGSNYGEVYRQLGLLSLPAALERQPEVQVPLEQLSREPCYRHAIYSLADALLDATYLRETDISLLNFAKRCGNSDEILVRRFKALSRTGDFVAALHVADDLANSAPADAQVRYWRGNVHEQLKDYPRALTDYINSLQLLGDPETVSVSHFYDISRVYALLGRYCDAISPLETYISFNLATNRTTQLTVIITEYANKGNCDAHYARGNARVARLRLPGMTTVNTLVVNINGVAGNFLIDTGATYVAVTREFASKAKLKLETGTQMPMKTVGGTASADLANATSVPALTKGFPAARVDASLGHDG